VKSESKVWVLGASSFTGQYLLPKLKAENYQVVTTEVDITKAKAVEDALLQIQPNYIINLAGISFVPDGENADIYAINTFGPQNILDASLKLKKAPKKIILASSSLIYGKQKQETIDESCIANPINHYGCSKWAMEQIAQNYQDKLDIIITRPFNYTGVGQDNKFLIPKIVEHFKQRKTTISLGNLDVWRDFSDVRWVTQAYSELLNMEHSGLLTVNLCSGELISIRAIIKILEKITGHTIKVQVAPQFIRPSDIPRQCGNGMLLQKIITMRPSNIEDTLAWMLAFRTD